MVIHDEDTLQQALSLVEQGPIRYSDTYVHAVISSPGSLEKVARTALERGDIAIVGLVGQELEDHTTEKSRILAQRKRQELKDVRKWFSEHLELRALQTEQEVIKLYRREHKGSLK